MELRGVAGVDGDTEKISRELVEGDRNCLRAGAGNGGLLIILYNLDKQGRSCVISWFQQFSLAVWLRVLGQNIVDRSHW